MSAPVWRYQCPNTDYVIELHDPDDGGAVLLVIDPSGSTTGGMYIDPMYATRLRDALDRVV